MDATDFYRQNASKHQRRSSLSAELVRGTLPRVPGGIAWAAHWIRDIARAEWGGQGGAALDIGCAELHTLEALEPYFSRRVGVDISEFPCWSEHSLIEAKVFNVDDGPLPFSDGTFDAVTMLMVLEHVFDPFHAVREVRRVLSERGVAVLHVPNLAGFKFRVALALGKLPITSHRDAFEKNSWDGYHIHNFTRRSLEWLLRKEGLEPFRWAVTGRMAQLRSRWPSLLGQDLVALCRAAAPRASPPSF